jgi:hypothetical protein
MGRGTTGRHRHGGGAIVNRTKVFISYSHDDEAWLRGMCTHLQVLEK